MIEVYRHNTIVCLIAVIVMVIQSCMAAEIDGQPLGFHVSKGAAAGYIDDQACKQCHPGHWQSYQHVGMSHSFVPVKAENFIENFDLPAYYHEPSKRYYHITRDGDDLKFTRYQLDHNNQRINVFERQIDWILGSGNRTRSYLYQTEAGEMFQLPLGWYSQTQQWLMSPGFEGAFHMGVQRPVKRECMFCHNAFPEVATGSDDKWKPHFFPHQLPEGTGCQRCHGPGANHVNKVIKGFDLEQIKAAIVNPAKLPPKQRDSVCFQCHLLPAVSMIGLRKFDRNVYSFRPGELLNDYMLHVDIDSQQQPKSERFEINHHAYRLRQSECFTKSNNQLTCISCHNPHKKVAVEDRAEHYAKVCLSCHTQEHPVLVEKQKLLDSGDCVACHMPERRTEDVIHVTMTDHKIQKNIASAHQRLAPLQRREPKIESLSFLMPEDSPKGIEGDVYKAISILKSVVMSDVYQFLNKVLSKVDNMHPQAYLELAKSQVILKQYDEAMQTLELVLTQQPENTKALRLQGNVYNVQQQFDKAIAKYKQALALNDQIADAHFNLALSYYQKQNWALASESLKKAIKIRPNLSLAWYYLAKLNVEQSHIKDGIAYYKKALSIDPAFERAYVELAKVLAKHESKQEALRYLQHGIQVTKDQSTLIKARQEIQ